MCYNMTRICQSTVRAGTFSAVHRPGDAQHRRQTMHAPARCTPQGCPPTEGSRLVPWPPGPGVMEGMWKAALLFMPQQVHGWADRMLLNVFVRINVFNISMMHQDLGLDA